MQGGETGQVEVAQVEDQQAASLSLGRCDGALDVAGAARFDVQLNQSAGLEVPENLEFQRGTTGSLAATTAFEEVGQLIGQVDGGGIADEDGGELLEQFGRGRLGGDGLVESALEDRAEEIDQGLTGGKAFLDGGLGELEAELGSGEMEVGPGGMGLVQEGNDDHQQQRTTRKHPLTQDDLAFTSEFIEFLIQIVLQRGGNSP